MNYAVSRNFSSILILTGIFMLSGCSPSPRYLSHPRHKRSRPEPRKKTYRSDYRNDTGITLGHPLRNLTASRINSRFGIRTHPRTGAREFHHGIDIESDTGDDVFAVADGVVAFSGRQKGYGKVVIIEHEKNCCSVYAHLSSTEVSKGASVTKGLCIGHVGLSGNATGSHLHFEIRIDGESVDPLKFLDLGYN
jgi:murein DD-endopeptidase MepM/ murein hydrolase activator NlpD